MFLVCFSCMAADSAQREGEAIYTSLLKHSALKIASKALSDVLEQRIADADEASSKHLRKEQEAWLAELYAAIHSAEPAMRVPLALRMTQERTLAFLSDNSASKQEPDKEQSPITIQPPSKDKDEQLRAEVPATDAPALKLPPLHPKISDSELRSFEGSLQSALKSLEVGMKYDRAGHTSGAANSEGSLTASQLLAAGLSLQTFLKSNPNKSPSLGPAGLAEVIAKAHEYVLLEAPEKRKASALEAEARASVLRKDFKKAAESYISALKLLEDMEVALGTDFDVFDRTVKGSPPSSLYTLVGDAQLQSGDFKGCLATAKRGLAVGQRVYKAAPCPWSGELNLLAAKAYFEMKSFVMAELTIREAIKQLTSVENSNLKQAKSLFTTILYAGKK